MQQLKTFMALALFAVLAGCSSSSSSSTTPTTTYSMTANTGSTTMNGGVCTASVVSGVLGIAGSTVTGSTGGPPQIGLTIAAWSGTTGSFTLGTGGTGGSFGTYIASASTFAKSSTTGTVTLTSVTSTVIKGTFNFTCTDGTVISAGIFTAQRT